MNSNINQLAKQANWVNLLQEAVDYSPLYPYICRKKGHKKFILSPIKEAEQLSIDQIIKKSRKYILASLLRENLILDWQFLKFQFAKIEPQYKAWPEIASMIKDIKEECFPYLLKAIAIHNITCFCKQSDGTTNDSFDDAVNIRNRLNRLNSKLTSDCQIIIPKCFEQLNGLESVS
jgi:hypothetical protein